MSNDVKEKIKLNRLFDNRTKNRDADFTFIDLFAGIGGIRLGFEVHNGKCVFSSEFDKFAQETYKENFDEIPHGDITEIHEEEIPEFDYLLAGFPCQPFSHAGLKKGFEDDRGTLFFDIARIVNHHHPSVLFLENVKGFKNHDKGRTFKIVKFILEKLGYEVHARVLNAKHFGVPQNRERIYIIAFLGETDFSFPEPPKHETRVGQILENKVPEKYTISEKLWSGHKRRKKENEAKGWGFGYSMFDEDSEYTSTMSARYYKDGSEILIKQEDKNPRKITPREAARLQGYPENFQIPVSDTQAYKQFGNSVAIPVIEAIAAEVVKAHKKMNPRKGNKINIEEIELEEALKE
ncbi:MAG: DNA cytosine methyltransferase [Candidatus Paceibacterota bacterium]